jgi:hypothetical protein
MARDSGGKLLDQGADSAFGFRETNRRQASRRRRRGKCLQVRRPCCLRGRRTAAHAAGNKGDYPPGCRSHRLRPSLNNSPQPVIMLLLGLCSTPSPFDSAAISSDNGGRWAGPLADTAPRRTWPERCWRYSSRLVVDWHRGRWPSGYLDAQRPRLQFNVNQKVPGLSANVAASSGWSSWPTTLLAT